MPAAADYNGMLVIWAHGFQDAGTPVAIPEDQLCLDDFCLPDLVNGLGFAFATNSYSKTGLAVVQGKDDILDLVNIFAAQHGRPAKVYLVGASEGGLITALNARAASRRLLGGRRGVRADRRLPAADQLLRRRAGDVPGISSRASSRATRSIPTRASWQSGPHYYELIVKPIVMDPANRSRLNQWVAVAQAAVRCRQLSADRRSVGQGRRSATASSTSTTRRHARRLAVRQHDALVFGLEQRLLLNQLVPRRAAAPAALTEMAARYQTSGVLTSPLITLHTLRDQQVPYWHEQLYSSRRSRRAPS